MESFSALLNQNSADILRNAKAKYQPDGKVKITLFSKAVFVPDGWERQDRGTLRRQGSEGQCSLTPRADNLRRAKNAVYEIAAANDWEYLVTLTLNAEKIDRYNAKEIVRPFTKWLHNQATRNGLRYLIIAEKHKDGAIHFHGLVNEALRLTDSGTVTTPDRKKPIKKATAKKYGYDLNACKAVYNIPGYKFGFATAIPLDENREAVSRYITKYVTKDFGKIFGKTYFAGGDGLRRELPFTLHNIPYEDFITKEYTIQGFGAVKYIQMDKSDFEEYIKGVA
ncbi:MAG: hypothetical protein J6K17_05945 [Oscillospiraceae bacterium]|nr:hypothetical protein [Oscillospiraceae bacterium]